MRLLGRLVVGVALALVSGLAVADDDTKWLPNSKLTPGAIAETRAAVICVHGYAKAHRVWHEKVATLAKYGIAPGQAFLFEDDDLVPVCLGGNNASPLNHWPQPLGGEWGAEKKDALEQRVCSEICLTRDDAQLARYQLCRRGGPDCPNFLPFPYRRRVRLFPDRFGLIPLFTIG